MFKKWLYKFSLRRAQSDLNEFLLYFKKLSPEEGAVLLIGVLKLKKRYEQSGIDIMNPSHVLSADPSLPTSINSIIKKLQKRQHFHGAALYTILLFTLRAEVYIETRAAVISIWRQLHQSIPLILSNQKKLSLDDEVIHDLYTLPIYKNSTLS